MTDFVRYHSPWLKDVAPHVSLSMSRVWLRGCVVAGACRVYTCQGSG